MHATSGRPIRGTLYPDTQGGEGRSIGAALPKVLAVLAAMAFVRMVVAGGRRHGGPSMHERRMTKLADLHRTLHAADHTAGEGGEVTA